jgi:hypothetical protein
MASKRRQRRQLSRECESKVRHATFEDAETAARNTHSYSSVPPEPYRCPGCGFWHVGHAPGTYGKTFVKFNSLARLGRR